MHRYGEHAPGDIRAHPIILRGGSPAPRNVAAVIGDVEAPRVVEDETESVVMAEETHLTTGDDFCFAEEDGGAHIGNERRGAERPAWARRSEWCAARGTQCPSAVRRRTPDNFAWGDKARGRLRASPTTSHVLTLRPIS